MSLGDDGLIRLWRAFEVLQALARGKIESVRRAKLASDMHGPPLSPRPHLDFEPQKWFFHQGPAIVTYCDAITSPPAIILPYITTSLPVK